ncbi:hypothetical protein Pyrfu_0949 [Pyrolobus fumarii 1A]|uniref:Uncharacterized protein n=1 Tax=Pyrolobus fumarii (strain DSM 11204 / 1A) TaxID=694429 RepID=G0EEC4_PYRF1|nr:hypothetical protein [Pyrolobus fumarii]AEM38818.1 hypothetical protein Pyrfu_0949 [Pyrolobus fumarii 1A]
MSTVEEGTAPLEAEYSPEPTSVISRSINILSERLSSIEAKVEAHEATIDALVASLDRLEELGSKASELHRVAVLIGEWKRLTCRHHVDGVCRAWRVKSDAGIPVATESGVPRPVVSKVPVLCALCPLYEPRR